MGLIDRQDLFDTLTVRLAEPQSRAGVVKLMAKAALAMVVFQAWPRRGYAQAVTDESQLVKGCKLPGQKCNNGKQDCCSRKCKKGAGRCGCINKGKEPLVKTPLGPVPVKALCCSNKINKRTSKCK
jgi:hypothetical protein